MGRNKATLPFRGAPLIARQIELLGPIFERIIIASSDPAPYAPFGVEVVPDVLPERCTLTGIHAVLTAARTECAFVVACDLPFLSPPLIQHLLNRRHGWDAVVPESDRGLEPLHAIYFRACIAPIEECARRGAWKADGFLGAVRTDRPRIRDAEWAVEGRSPFLNANTPAEWELSDP